MGTNTFVLNVFSIFKVLVEEISFGRTSIRICYKSLPRANDDTFSKCVSIIRCGCISRFLINSFCESCSTSRILKRTTLKAASIVSVARIFHMHMVMVVVMNMRHMMVMVHNRVLEELDTILVCCRLLSLRWMQGFDGHIDIIDRH